MAVSRYRFKNLLRPTGDPRLKATPTGAGETDGVYKTQIEAYPPNENIHRLAFRKRSNRET